MTVEDNIAPEFEAESNVTVSLDPSGQATLSPDDIGWEGGDNCDEDLTPGISPESRTVFNCGDVGMDISVSFTVTDDSGNDADPQNIGVNVVDEIAPEAVGRNVISLVSNEDQERTAQASLFDAASSDNCDNLHFRILFLEELDGGGERVGTIEFGDTEITRGVGKYLLELQVFDRDLEDEGVLYSIEEVTWEVKVGDIDNILNEPPEFFLDDQITAKNTPIVIKIEFSDPDGDEVTVVEVVSSNPDVISNENIFFEEREDGLFLIIKPNAFATGETTVSITITDGTDVVLVTFTVIVSEVTGIEELISQAIQDLS